jgi:outer membrane protein assembly factor BamB
LSFPVNEVTYVGYSAETGEQLWRTTKELPSPQTTFALYGAMGSGIFTEFIKSEMRWYGFNASTGEQIWGPSESYTNAWGVYSFRSTVAYDKLYTEGYDGMVHCFDLKTGKHLWDYWTGSSGLETSYGTWPLYAPIVVADEKVYVATGQHSPSQPLWRGGKLYCIDAETGEGLWNVSGWYQGNKAIADGYLVAFNWYDNQLYCYGKGETVTTVTASPKVVSDGGTVLIEGTVTDQSPGAKDTPAIDDANMSAWMEYLYMQKPCPTDAKGVPVLLQAIRSDGTTINIATVTSDARGHYEAMWTPAEPDEYKILATFTGSGAYWSSSAETAIGFDPSATSPMTKALAYTTIDVVIVVAVAIAIIIGIVNLYMLRKRK